MTSQKNETQERFKSDMEEAGLEVETYRGRNFYRGYAVSVSRIQEATPHTKIILQWDQLGLGYIVYPTGSASMTEEQFKAAEDAERKAQEEDERMVEEKEED